jgi:hypothetical protein
LFGLLRAVGGNDDIVDIDSKMDHVLATTTDVEAGVSHAPLEIQGEEEDVELFVPQARALTQTVDSLLEFAHEVGVSVQAAEVTCRLVGRRARCRREKP